MVNSIGFFTCSTDYIPAQPQQEGGGDPGNGPSRPVVSSEKPLYFGGLDSQSPEPLITQCPNSKIPRKETANSLKSPIAPFEFMPRFQNPMVSPATWPVAREAAACRVLYGLVFPLPYVG